MSDYSLPAHWTKTKRHRPTWERSDGVLVVAIANPLPNDEGGGDEDWYQPRSPDGFRSFGERCESLEECIGLIDGFCPMDDPD